MKIRRGWLALPLVLLLAPLAGAIDEDEFACEEAWKHLDDCCPRPPRFHCGGGCDPVDVHLPLADQLRKATCEQLEASGACAADFTEGAQ